MFIVIKTFLKWHIRFAEMSNGSFNFSFAIFQKVFLLLYLNSFPTKNTKCVCHWNIITRNVNYNVYTFRAVILHFFEVEHFMHGNFLLTNACCKKRFEISSALFCYRHSIYFFRHYHNFFLWPKNDEPVNWWPHSWLMKKAELQFDNKKLIQFCVRLFNSLSFRF